jgi:hypothetical protein
MASQMIEGPSAIGEPAIWHMIAGVKLLEQSNRVRADKLQIQV